MSEILFLNGRWYKCELIEDIENYKQSLKDTIAQSQKLAQDTLQKIEILENEE